MKRSMSIVKIAAALCRAQHEIKGAVADSNNPFYNSKYADLASCFEAIKEPFFKNGLCVLQTLTGADILQTMLMHESGEFFISEIKIVGYKAVRTSKNGKEYTVDTRSDPQAFGSMLTYYRRYSLAAICGLSQVDDDANLTTQGPKETTKQPNNNSSNPTKEKQAASKKKDDSAEKRAGYVNEAMSRLKEIPDIESLKQAEIWINGKKEFTEGEKKMLMAVWKKKEQELNKRSETENEKDQAAYPFGE